MIDVEKFPLNYDWLPIEKQECILNWFRAKSALADKLQEESKDLVHYQQLYDRYSKGYWDVIHEIHKQAEFLEKTLGLQVHYDFRGHRGEWALITYGEALIEEEAQLDYSMDV